MTLKLCEASLFGVCYPSSNVCRCSDRDEMSDDKNEQNYFAFSPGVRQR